jgi:hypothetical protein
MTARGRRAKSCDRVRFDAGPLGAIELSME